MLTLLASPLLVAMLIGWTHRAAAAVPDESIGADRALDAPSVGAAAIADVWSRFERAQGAQAATLADLRAWFDREGLVGAGELRPLYGLPMPPGHGELYFRRDDAGDHVRLTLRRSHGDPAALEASEPAGDFAVRRARWEGSDDVLVAQDLDCVLCHVTVTPAAGTRRAARVAALGDVTLRADARLTVAGVLHLGGTLRNGAGAPQAMAGLERLRFLPLATRDERPGLGTQDELRMRGVGASTVAAVAPGTLSSRADVAHIRPSSGRPGASEPHAGSAGSGGAGHGLELALAGEARPLEALDAVRLGAREGQLLGRCSGATRRLTFALPRGFPSFEDIAPVARGVGLSGGRGGTVALGGRLAEDDAGGFLTRVRSVDGHLWAIGTEADPLVLDGDVTIEGDLLVAGVVRGSGSLRVQGDVVIAGSLRSDGPLAIVAGGSLFAGAAIDADGLGRFAREVTASDATPLPWVAPARIRRMGDRDGERLVLEAYCYARHHVVAAVSRTASTQDVYVRGGLAGEVVAVHAPGELVLEDAPEARELLQMTAPRGLELTQRR